MGRVAGFALHHDDPTIQTQVLARVYAEMQTLSPLLSVFSLLDMQPKSAPGKLIARGFGLVGAGVRKRSIKDDEPVIKPSVSTFPKGRTLPQRHDRR